MMCTCRCCGGVALAVGVMIASFAGIAQADMTKVPNRISATDVPLTARGGGDCDSSALCDGDVNGDESVDPLDSGAILARFGLDPCLPGNRGYDVNCDGSIDPLDSGYVLARFGTCGPVPPVCGACPPPANDDCANAVEVFLGDTEYCTFGATTDGPVDCDADTGNSDIWFFHEVTQSGNLVFSQCATGDDPLYDPTISVYDGTSCPPGAPLACSDDDCGIVGGPGQVTVLSATPGDVLLIRVGGWNNGEFHEAEQGGGILNVDDYGGPCCTGHDLPGCDEIDVGDPAEVEACVCDIDPFCCAVMWDDTCADFIEQFACGSCLPATCGAGNGDCCLEAGNGTPGCDDEECCDSVCDFDSFCCDTDWDELCAGLAGNCVVCGGDGCVPPDCEACCFIDGTCQDLEPAVCVAGDGGNQGVGTTCAGGGCEGSSCPDGADGDCCVDNGTPGCDDPVCCALVCDIDPFCCDVGWDAICVGEAEELCELCAP